MTSICVVGTDTGVGKTLVSCGLAANFLAMGYATAWQKWVATGIDQPPTDLDFCRRIAPDAVGGQPLLHQPCAYSFAASPHLAASREGRIVDIAEIKAAFQVLAKQYDLVVAEGVGGLLVPLTRQQLLIDFVAEIGLPVVLVARSGVGTINHTLLSLEALRARAVQVCGVIFSDETADLDPDIVRDNMQTIETLGGAAMLGRLPYLTKPEQVGRYLQAVARRVLAVCALSHNRGI